LSRPFRWPPPSHLLTSDFPPPARTLPGSPHAARVASADPAPICGSDGRDTARLVPPALYQPAVIGTHSTGHSPHLGADAWRGAGRRAMRRIRQGLRRSQARRAPGHRWAERACPARSDAQFDAAHRASGATPSGKPVQRHRIGPYHRRLVLPAAIPSSHRDDGLIRDPGGVRPEVCFLLPSNLAAVYPGGPFFARLAFWTWK
ncbi:hypothetical protein LCGC14_0241870, partial [marine sediment metagenome]